MQQEYLIAFQMSGTKQSIRTAFGMLSKVSFAMADYLPVVPFDRIVGIASDAKGGFLGALGPRLKTKIISIWTSRYVGYSVSRIGLGTMLTQKGRVASTFRKPVDRQSPGPFGLFFMWLKVWAWISPNRCKR